MRTANIQTTQNASYGARSGDNNGIGGNSGGSVLIGDMNVYALDGRPVGVQRTFMDNFGLTRQSKPAIINREYVIDYTNPYNRDLAVYEEGSYVTNYTYGLGLDRISQTVMNYPNKTEVGIEGQNSYTDLAVEKYEKLYIHQDRLGSTIRMTRENGTTIAWADYDEWGKPRSPRDHDMNMAGVDNAIGFTSYTYDTVLDKFFAQARFYDATNRRFMASDPMKNGTNWYSYCINNPVVFVDPSGLVIIVNGIVTTREMIMEVLQQLTDYELTLNADYTVSIAHDKASPSDPSPTSARYRGDKAKGTELLDRLIESDETVRIVVSRDGYRARYSNPENTGNGVGSDVTVLINPWFVEPLPTVDPKTGNVVAQEFPDFIGLGHELIHADRATRGVRLFGEEEYRYQVGRTMWTCGPFFGYNYTYDTQVIRKEDLATMRLKYNRPNDITENMLRAEHGLNPRGAY